MTEKRFGIIKTKTYDLYVPVDKIKVYNFSGFESELDCIRVVDALNDLEEKSRENGKIASKYLEENEQLKKELKIYRKVAYCGNCNYHNYDWYDDGDEFEVCEKGNDMSDDICEEWREL